MVARSNADIADDLVALYHTQFANKKSGKYRISRKYFRDICGRRKLPDSFLNGISEEVFERGFVLVDVESFYVIFNQQLFRSYRRATEAAINALNGAKRVAASPQFEVSVPDLENEIHAD